MVVVAVYQQEFYNPEISGIKISYPKIKYLNALIDNTDMITRLQINTMYCLLYQHFSELTHCLKKFKCIFIMTLQKLCVRSWINISIWAAALPPLA